MTHFPFPTSVTYLQQLTSYHTVLVGRPYSFPQMPLKKEKAATKENKGKYEKGKIQSRVALAHPHRHKPPDPLLWAIARPLLAPPTPHSSPSPRGARVTILPTSVLQNGRSRSLIPEKQPITARPYPPSYLRSGLPSEGGPK